MAKGGQFEREICRLLSEWWTDGIHDDVFWRTSNSGGRATAREKSGQRTQGQYGDVGVNGTLGAELIDVFTIELKRGYQSETIHDHLDRLDSNAEQTWEKWIRTARRDHERAGSLSWAIIHRRDRRKAWIYVPSSAYLMLRGLGALDDKLRPAIGVALLDGSGLFGTLLSNFLQEVTPDHVKQLALS